MSKRSSRIRTKKIIILFIFGRSCGTQCDRPENNKPSPSSTCYVLYELWCKRYFRFRRCRRGLGHICVSYTRLEMHIYIQYRSVLMSVRCGGEPYLYDIKMVPIRRALPITFTVNTLKLKCYCWCSRFHTRVSTIINNYKLLRYNMYLRGIGCRAVFIYYNNIILAELEILVYIYIAFKPFNIAAVSR